MFLGKFLFSKSWAPVHPVTFLCKHQRIKASKLQLLKKGMGHIFDAVSRFGLRFGHRFEHRFRKTRRLHLMGRELQRNLQEWRKIGPPNQIPHLGLWPRTPASRRNFDGNNITTLHKTPTSWSFQGLSATPSHRNHYGAF